ncbi:MAG: gamma-glutamyltransferase [Saprospirales bacterium]|nr:gamma-glutamyltransferase [Saprospirales bacterium]
MTKSVIYLLFSFLFLLISCREIPSYTAQKTAYSTGDMIAAAHPLAVQAGHAIFEKGGNAIDAAIAVQFALAVVCPRAGNLGGGGFLVLRTPEGQIDALDYREKAPLASSRNMYLDSLGEVIQDASLYGHLAVGVPGTVRGLYEAHRKYGRLNDFGDLLGPAIHLAKKGFRITEVEAERLNKFQSDFLKYNTSPNPFAVEKTWKTGDLLVQPELAATLERIRDDGPDGFYQGETARLLLEEMERGGGIITQADLDQYNAVWRAPLVGPYKNYRIISMPPPSSGSVALLQMLHILEHYHLKPNDPASLHVMIEAMRRAYADRAYYLGDPDFFDVPVDSLLNEAYLAQRMADFSPDSASSSAQTQRGEFSVKLEHFETTHTSVVDAEGMAVGITTTLNSNYGSKVVVGGAGFFLNNQMDDFSIKPGVPNQFGLVGGEANAIEPGKRMLSSMTPTIVEKDGQLYMVLGSPGGSTIITSILQVILNVVEYDMDLPAAVAAPRIHHQWLPDEVWLEEVEISPALKAALQAKGHTLVEKKSIGRVKAIQILPDGRRCGAGDPRNPDDDAG